MTNGDLRTESILGWLRENMGPALHSFAPASGDASFRRYFRAIYADERYIVMDAPPERENAANFVKVAELFKSIPLNVPGIVRSDLDRGFMLLEDFGDCQYLQMLTADNADSLYGKALDSLFKLQTGIDRNRRDLPRYDAALLQRELDIFREWFMQGWLQLDVDTDLRQLLAGVEAELIRTALQQPQVVVHRDYHSRNLMYLGAGEPGILDFQDAVIGPITYDLVSLLKDCYIAWPEARVEQWMSAYYRRLLQAGLVACDLATFRRWFDLMGMQRHLKAIGIFARLHLRDAKSHYLGDIPRTVDYVLAVCGRYPEFERLHAFLRQLVLPL
ncbi:MAG: aminoglycoside phosphotransferase family protein [Gammaproteobacteria bacterium]